MNLDLLALSAHRTISEVLLSCICALEELRGLVNKWVKIAKQDKYYLVVVYCGDESL